ncbi:MAG: response regulator [Bacillota bacterium]|nr:response regulator [Bacillota bacterium]
MKKIKIILADDNTNTRSSIRKQLELDHSIDVAAEAATGKEVLDKIRQVEPEIVLMDINMPEMDGIKATQQISSQYPQVYVILISVIDKTESFRKAMIAGAKEYLVKPLSAAELNATVRQVAELRRKQQKLPKEKSDLVKSLSKKKENKIVTVFGTKGGVGKSLICTNLAVAAAQKYKNHVGIVDLDIQFGDISVMMDLNPRKTISELMQEGEEPGKELLEEYVYERNGVNVLAAPNKPEFSELVTPAGVEKVLEVCKELYRFTLVDTPSFLDDTTLTALEVADLILLVISLDLPTIKNVKKGLEVLRSLQMLPKTRLILNRSSGIAGIEPRDVEKVLDMKIKAEVPSDGKLVISSLNQGIPFVRMNPKAPVSKGILSVLKVIEE